MEIAETIVQLVAHVGVLEAEVSAIDDDMRKLKAIASRYKADESSSRDETVSPSSSRRARGTVGATSSASASSSFVLPGAASALSQLKALRQTKSVLIAEINQQLSLFKLHHASAQQLTRRLSAAQSIVVPPVLGVSLSVLSDSAILAQEYGE